MEIRNNTPFLPAQTVFLDKTGAEHLVVVLKATFSIAPSGTLAVAEEQLPLSPADQFYGDPAFSSIKQEAELEPPKLATDAFLIGSAVAQRAGTRSQEVCLRVRDREKWAMAIGNRRWVKRMGGATFTEAEPFESVLLAWENSFGGTDLTPDDPANHGHEARNPVGRGFRAKNSQAEWEGVLLPNVENPVDYVQAPDQRVDPVGFGPIGRNWQPRLSYAGTYDKEWIEKRMPLLPHDFDERFHNAAAPDMVIDGYAQPGDWVDVIGCTPEGRVYFQLPDLAPTAQISVGANVHDIPLNCNTLTVDTHKMCLTLLFKNSVRIHKQLPRLRRTSISAHGWKATAIVSQNEEAVS